MWQFLWKSTDPIYSRTDVDLEWRRDPSKPWNKGGSTFDAAEPESVEFRERTPAKIVVWRSSPSSYPSPGSVTRGISLRILFPAKTGAPCDAREQDPKETRRREFFLVTSRRTNSSRRTAQPYPLAFNLTSNGRKNKSKIKWDVSQRLSIPYIPVRARQNRNR